MDTPSIIGLGIGFCVVGVIFSVLSAVKPDLPMFKKSNSKRFYQNQGTMVMFIFFGLLLIYQGAVINPGASEDMNPAAVMLGTGVGFAVLGTILSLLSIYKPNVGIFKNCSEKKLYQTQGALMMCAGFGVVFIILGLMGKPWAL